MLLYGALRAICGIGQAVDNSQMKKESFGYTDKGEPTYLDRNCNRYINGEKVIATYDYTNKKLVYTGQKTGKVYYDYQQDLLNKRNTEDEEEKETILREYHEWEKTFPKFLCDRTEKALQKERLKNTIAELQEKLDKMDKIKLIF